MQFTASVCRERRDDGPLGQQQLGSTRDISRMIQGTANITVFPRERLSFRLGTLYSDAMKGCPNRWMCSSWSASRAES